MNDFKFDQNELDKLSLTDLYNLHEYLAPFYLGVPFDQEIKVVNAEIEKRVKNIFPNFDLYKQS